MIKKVQHKVWRNPCIRFLWFGLCKAILLLFFLSGGFAYGQNDGSDWRADSPVKYQVEIYIPGSSKIKGEVKIQYYLQKDGKRFYRKTNNPNRKFGENTNLNETDEFKVQIEFRTIRGNPNEEALLLVIPGPQWVSSDGCLKEANNFKDDFKVHMGGFKELSFDLKAGCDRPSEIRIDFNFVKNGRILEFKISRANSSKPKSKFGKLNKKASTSVTIPIKVGYSNKAIKDAKDAFAKAAKASAAAEKALDQVIKAANEIERAKGQALIAKTKKEATEAANDVAESVRKAKQVANRAEQEALKAENALTQVEAAVKAAKGNAAKKETEKIEAKVKRKVSEADDYAMKANLEFTNAKHIAKEAAYVASLVIDNATWLKEIEKEISNQDLLTQIKSLESRMNKENNPAKKTLLNNAIIGTVETFFKSSILKTDPCGQIVKDFSRTRFFNNYLSKKSKEKYKVHLASCGTSTKKNNQSDKQAFATAETTNTIEAYKDYIKNFPNGEKVEKAKSEINALRKKDDEAWEKAIREAEGKQANNESVDFRIESKDQNSSKGVYTFEIKNGSPPFTIEPFNNDEVIFNINNKTITLNILQKGNYKIKAIDKTGATTSHILEAQHPNLQILEKDGDLIVAGGQGPFDLFVERFHKLYSIDSRSIKKEVLINKLGLNEDFHLQAIDKYDAKSERIFIKSNVSDEDGNNIWSFSFLAIVVLTAILFFFRNKIPFFQKTNVQEWD